jgi:hypothetical protein
MPTPQVVTPANVISWVKHIPKPPPPPLSVCLSLIHAPASTWKHRTNWLEQGLHQMQPPGVLFHRLIDGPCPLAQHIFHLGTDMRTCMHRTADLLQEVCHAIHLPALPLGTTVFSLRYPVGTLKLTASNPHTCHRKRQCVTLEAPRLDQLWAP